LKSQCQIPPAAPSRIEEALDLLSRFGEEAGVLAGKTDVLVKMKEKN